MGNYLCKYFSFLPFTDKYEKNRKEKKIKMLNAVLNSTSYL